nr:MAG TPA: zinc finger domain protein [Caudoviricetes sp.]
MMEWIDNADSWVCPICGYECDNPNRLPGIRCICGFKAQKDGEKK